MLYAHAAIETPDGLLPRGAEVPEDLSGVESLQEWGSVSADPYVAPPGPSLHPNEPGVRHVYSTDNAEAGDARP